MKRLVLMLRHSGAYSAVALLLFLSAWHAYTVASSAAHAQDKLRQSLRQSAPRIEHAAIVRDVIKLRNLIGQSLVPGVTGLRFTGAVNAPPIRFSIGDLESIGEKSLERTHDIVYNGARLGKVEFAVNYSRLNRDAFRNNKSLYAAVTIFMLVIVFLANAGTLRTLERLETRLSLISDSDDGERLQTIRNILARSESESTDPVSRSLYTLLKRYTDQVDRSSRIQRELTLSRELTALASQVSHDIRSPLTALKSAINAVDPSGSENARLAHKAIGRIGEIADDLLDRYRGSSERYDVPASPTATRLLDITAAIKDGIAEKRASAPVNIEIGTPLLEKEPAFVRLDAKEFSRLFSNLLNNAIEAMKHGGSVRCELQTDGEVILLLIRDKGEGIPQVLLDRLANPGETHGKEGGSGLGLAHAKSRIESWGGTFAIESTIGTGTTIRLSLPAPIIVLIDDDALTRKNWTIAAKRAGLDCRTFADSRSFFAAAEKLPKRSEIYVDSKLGEDEPGERLALKIRANGFSLIFVTTGRVAEELSNTDHLSGIIGKAPPWT
ncbi:MAG: hypothetical protein CO113_09960 [Elusimicrobia bacterium CG_4_9_14_3_um_filter_62_55]|nr:MAG: hypothetical protein COX66_10055 [Elusimicrobia bacterium CG_4_10_14_0_2_um_filter_63_34]PJB25191.1 MAG: hypothetical protein CO113_09960 [Elusimicrobia bacterium CG_4_9_14_3_um_filter_62_55]